MAEVKQTITIPDKEVKKYAGNQIRKLEKEVTRLTGFVSRRDKQIGKLKGQIDALKKENKGLRDDRKLIRMRDALGTLLELMEEANEKSDYRECDFCASSFYDPLRESHTCPICGEII